MRARIIIYLLLLLVSPLKLHSQTVEISIRLIDQSSKLAVADAHIFLENSSYGTVSNKEGYAQLTIPQGTTEDLLISHVSYKLKIIEYENYLSFSEKKETYLELEKLEFEALVVVGKRSKKWKKQFKSFRKAFLGTDKIAKQCVILNPEVLRFEEVNKTLSVTAVDLLKIDNPYLGYELLYLLNSLEITDDGSTEYSGRAQFIDKYRNEEEEQILQNRLDLYLQSPKHFFRSLIENKHEEAGFNVAMMNYLNGNFIPRKDFNRNELLQGPDVKQNYKLKFEEFLRVYNTDSRSVTYKSAGVRPGGLESQRFSGSIREEKAIENFEMSYLYKVTPYIILDIYGNVLNSKYIKEYGRWAGLKVAHQLPFDYGFKDFQFKEIYSPDGFEDKDSTLSNAEIISLFESFLYEDDMEQSLSILDSIHENWEDGFAPPLIEFLRLIDDPILVEKINGILKNQFSISSDKDYFGWLQWLWTREIQLEAYYFNIKSEIYRNIDPVFDHYFKNRVDSISIDLDEVVWGGVLQDGIPPLRDPQMILAGKADYLDDGDIVFGLYINGEARAYPKRILAWHEFFTDNFGAFEVAGVYCTLCGTLIAYDMRYEGVLHQLGTSGFLYRSNKLMYDKSSQSLWSTIQGRPVIGPLVEKNINLNTFPVVTSNWGEWRKKHPDTKVLSIDTGYDRDYSEGAAYKKYFANDQLMFPVISLDDRLKNKDEVVIVRIDGYTTDPMAISLSYLKKNGWHQDIISNQSVIVVSDDSGAARAYESNGISFKDLKDETLYDKGGGKWNIEEEYLENESGKRLKRITSHNIFWFAWYNIYPETRLIK